MGGRDTDCASPLVTVLSNKGFAQPWAGSILELSLLMGGRDRRPRRPPGNPACCRVADGLNPIRTQPRALSCVTGYTDKRIGIGMQSFPVATRV